MKKVSIAVLITLTFAYLFTANNSAAGTQIKTAPLPAITLITPDNSKHIEYLGLQWDAGTPFNFSNIDADILVIELFNLYCTSCQNAAPNVNALYELMEQHSKPGFKIVIIGIGAKNTELDVDTFRAKYDIDFPLFPDKDIAIYKVLEGAGTPTFIAAKKDGGDWMIFFRKAGGFADPQEFFDSLVDKSGFR